MTVKVEDRQESKVEYLDTARQISKRTAQMVSNGPKKYLATYGDHLMRLSLKIFTHVDIANSIYVTSERDHEQRRSHLVEARGLCYSIESTAKLYTDLITASHTASSEKAYGRLADIARLCHKERGLIKGVMESDRKRYIMRPQRDNVVRERRRIKRNIEAVLSGGKTAESERQSWESWRSHCLRLDAHRTVAEMEAYRQRLLEDAGLA